MRYILILLIVSSIISGCDNRKDIFEEINSSPVVKVSKLNDTTKLNYIYDSVKLGQDYKFHYLVKDEQVLTIEQIKVNGFYQLTLDNGTGTYKPDSSGLSKARLKSIDCYDKGDSSEVEIFCFENLPPVCIASAKKIANLSPYEVEIDLSKCFDLDAKWGGKIVKYFFRMGTNYEFESVHSTIRYIYQSAGQKQITVRCQDNNGVWTNDLILYLTI